MSKITDEILPQNFEIIRDRIVLILTTELAGQFVITGNEENNATVELEKGNPVDAGETPLVDVSIERAQFDGHTAISTDDTVIYSIDCYHKAKSTIGTQGDISSNLKLERLMGICRAILENPIYKQLDFDDPELPSPSNPINHRKFVAMEINRAQKPDAANAVMGRLSFSVKVQEQTQLLLGLPLAGSDTKVKLGLTDKGYTYSQDT